MNKYIKRSLGVVVLLAVGFLGYSAYLQNVRIAQLEQIAMGIEQPTPPPGGAPGYTPPAFNAAAFYDVVRAELFGGSMSQQQVDGHKVITVGCALFKLEPSLEQCAYIMATTFHETAQTMAPIAEYYGSTTRYAPWYGRGYVMITWEENYKKQQDKMEPYATTLAEYGIPWQVHDDKELALTSSTSAIITVAGMRDGDFTGLKLSDYINSSKIDFVGARKIVNGTDKDDLIAGYADIYVKAYKAALDGAVQEPSNHP